LIVRSPLLALFAMAGMFVTLEVGSAEGFRLNTTASMPVGVWRVTPLIPAQVKRGGIVTVCLPDLPVVHQGVARGYIHAGSCPSGLEPVVKPIAAIGGDVVSVGRSGISVNGSAVHGTAQLARDAGGRALHSVSAGVYTVEPGHVWLLALRNRRSFDSRYFGGIPVSSIQAAARPLWVLP